MAKPAKKYEKAIAEVQSLAGAVIAAANEHCDKFPTLEGDAPPKSAAKTFKALLKAQARLTKTLRIAAAAFDEEVGGDSSTTPILD